MLALAGLVIGLAVAVSWLPPQKSCGTVRVVERFEPADHPVAPGRRAVVLAPDGKPARSLDVFLTEQLPGIQRLRPRTRTNQLGQVSFEGVPAGRYRVQAYDGQNAVIDRIIDVPADEHPDLELRLETVSLFQLLALE